LVVRGDVHRAEQVDQHLRLDVVHLLPDVGVLEGDALELRQMFESRGQSSSSDQRTDHGGSSPSM